MGKLYADIPDDLEKRFRVRVLEIYGAKRGALRKAIKEAVEMWLKSTRRRSELDSS